MSLFRMSSRKYIALFCIVTFLYLPSVSIAQTTVSLSAQTNPISVGDTAALECQVLNPPGSNYIVTFLRQTATANERLTWAGSVTEEHSHRMTLEQRSDGVELLIIYDVATGDEGEYTCDVYGAFDTEIGSFVSLANDLLSLHVQQDSPDTDATPYCESNPDLYEPITEGTTFALICSVPDSTPRVDLEWSNSRGREPGQYTRIDGGKISSSFTRLATSEDNGAVFVCSAKNPAFPEKESQRCHLGPMIVQQNPDQPRPTGRPDVGETTEKVEIVDKTGKTKRVIEKCMAFCSALVDLE